MKPHESQHDFGTLDFCAAKIQLLSGVADSGKLSTRKITGRIPARALRSDIEAVFELRGTVVTLRCWCCLLWGVTVHSGDMGYPQRRSPPSKATPYELGRSAVLSTVVL